MAQREVLPRRGRQVGSKSVAQMIIAVRMGAAVRTGAAVRMGAPHSADWMWRSSQAMSQALSTDATNLTHKQIH